MSAMVEDGVRSSKLTAANVASMNVDEVKNYRVAEESEMRIWPLLCCVLWCTERDTPTQVETTTT